MRVKTRPSFKAIQVKMLCLVGNKFRQIIVIKLLQYLCYLKINILSQNFDDVITRVSEIAVDTTHI